MYFAPTRQHHIRGEARLVDFSLECQDKEMDVRRLIDDDDGDASDDDDADATEHFLCVKRCAPGNCLI